MGIDSMQAMLVPSKGLQWDTLAWGVQFEMIVWLLWRRSISGGVVGCWRTQLLTKLTSDLISTGFFFALCLHTASIFGCSSSSSFFPFLILLSFSLLAPTYLANEEPERKRSRGKLIALTIHGIVLMMMMMPIIVLFLSMHSLKHAFGWSWALFFIFSCHLSIIFIFTRSLSLSLICRLFDEHQLWKQI